jgi:polysaccharide biosynthesis protein PslH
MNRAINVCFTSTYDVLDPSFGGGARVLGLLKGLNDLPEIGRLFLIYPFGRTLNKEKTTIHRYFSHRSLGFLHGLKKVSIFDEISPFRNMSLLKTIREFKIDILQNEGIWGGISSTLISSYCNIPIIIDEHNYEAVYAKEVRRSLPIQLYSNWLESRVLRSASHILAVSQADKQNISFAHDIPFEKISVIPNGVTINEVPSINLSEAKSMLQLDGKFVIVFHGRLDYGPNRDAVSIIKDFIVPRVRKRIKNSFFLFVGKNPPYYPLNDSFMRFTGYVPNLNSHLSASDLAIVPLMRGGGTKLKLLDYLAIGMPIVATKKAVEGLPIENNVHALLSDRVDEEFVENIFLLYNDMELRQKLSKNCINLAQQYDWKKIAKVLVQAYRRNLKD